MGLRAKTTLRFTEHVWQEKIPLADFSIMWRKLKMVISDQDISEYGITKGESISSKLVDLLRARKDLFQLPMYRIEMRTYQAETVAGAPEQYKQAKFNRSLSMDLTEVHEFMISPDENMTELLIDRIPENIQKTIRAKFCH